MFDVDFFFGGGGGFELQTDNQWTNGAIFIRQLPGPSEKHRRVNHVHQLGIGFLLPTRESPWFW